MGVTNELTCIFSAPLVYDIVQVAVYFPLMITREGRKKKITNRIIVLAKPL